MNRRFWATQCGLVLALLLEGSGVFYAETLGHPVSRMRGPAFAQKDLDEIAQRPVQAPYEDLEAYRQVYQVLHREREWPTLGHARSIAMHQLAIGRDVALPPTVGAIVAPEFNARQRRDAAREEFRVAAFSVRPILDESPPLGTLHHYPVRPGEDFFVYAGAGIWAAGNVHTEAQGGPLAAPGTSTKAQFHFPLRVTYLGKTPIKKFIFQVHYQYPAAPSRTRQRTELQTCFPERHAGKVYTKEHALNPGESMDVLCPVTLNTATLEDASGFLRTLNDAGLPGQVGILQQFEFESRDDPSPYARGLLARAEWITPVAYECGTHPLCLWNQWLFDLKVLPLVANFAFMFALAGFAVASWLTALGRAVFDRMGATILPLGIVLAAAIAATFAIFGGGYGVMAALVTIPWIAGGYVAGAAWTHWTLRASA